MKNNIFIGNKAAIFANDFYTFPLRAVFFNDEQKNLMKYKYVSFNNVVPGITNINLNFVVVDYYGQSIKSLDLMFFFICDFHIHNINY